MEGLC